MPASGSLAASVVLRGRPNRGAQVHAPRPLVVHDNMVLHVEDVAARKVVRLVIVDVVAVEVVVDVVAV
eukprot:11649060-Heterocapsa_arctica.AAC.1